MRLTFLGHQGWMVESEDHRLLIDPILTSWFRNSPHSRVWMNPPRAISLERLGHVDAVLFTHEHEDHFHIASIATLPRAVTLYLSANMSAAAERILREMGFADVHRVHAMDRVPLGRASIMTLFAPPSASSERWVLQPLITGRRPGESFFNPVDCRPSPDLVRHLEQADIDELGLVCMANNMQSPRSLHVPTDRRRARARLGRNFEPGRVLQSPMAFARLPMPRYFAVVGGGFVDETSPFGTYLAASQSRLAELLMEYSHGATHVFGPQPGDAVDLSAEGREVVQAGNAARGFVPDMLVPDAEGAAAIRALEARAAAYAPDAEHDYPPVTGRRTITDVELAELEARLCALAVRLSATEFHVEMMQQSVCREGEIPAPYGPGRLLLELRREVDEASPRPEHVWFEYRPTEAAFVRRRAPQGDPMRRAPFGFECWAFDLLELLRGHAVVFEILKYRHRFWAPVESVVGPHSFPTALEHLFAPEVCNDATYTLYAGAWQRCRAPNADEAGPEAAARAVATDARA